jgi:tetratricopeptide (TPR) repeat protein
MLFPADSPDHASPGSARAGHGPRPVEAIAQFTRRLDVLKMLPEIPGQTQHELLLQTALGRSPAAAKGYAAPEVAQAYGRALALCRQLGEVPQLFPVLVGLRAFHLVRAELPRARELAEQLWRLAQRTSDPTFPLAAHQALGHTLFQLGEFAAARRHLEEGVTFYNPQHPSFRTLTGEQDLKMFCLAYMARVLWLLGYPDQALQRSDDALTHARKLVHPYTLAHALWCGLSMHQWRGEEHTAWQWSEAVMPLASEQGLAQQLMAGSPKASTPPTCKRPKRCLTSCPDIAPHRVSSLKSGLNRVLVGIRETLVQLKVRQAF